MEDHAEPDQDHGGQDGRDAPQVSPVDRGQLVVACRGLLGSQLGHQGIVSCFGGRGDLLTQCLHFLGLGDRFFGCVPRLDLGGDLGTNEHTQAEREQDQQALGLGPDRLGCRLVGVNLAGDEEEVVADAVQPDASDDHPTDFVGGTQ